MTRWLVIGLAVATMIFAISGPFRRRKDPLEKKRPPGSSLSQQRSVEREMSNLLVELSNMARQITAQLDTRAAKLELLIKEADEKIATLKAASAGGWEGNSAVLPTGAPGASEAPPPEDPRHREVYSLADDGHSAREIAQRLDRPHGEIELILALRPVR